MNKPSIHENLSSTDDVKSGSDKSFGIVFAVVFGTIGLLPLWNDEAVRIWALIIAGLFLCTALIFPRALNPLNRIWFQFGLLLHKIISPVVMGLIFFGAVMPTGILMRIFGKKPLDLDFDPSLKSYWVHRTPPSPEPGSMKRQF
jgi:hypothetical protein